MMDNPHNPEVPMWKAYMEWMGAYAKNRSDTSAKDTGEYYLDQWWKIMERRVAADPTVRRLKNTPADKMKVRLKTKTE